MAKPPFGWRSILGLVLRPLRDPRAQPSSSTPAPTGTALGHISVTQHPGTHRHSPRAAPQQRTRPTRHCSGRGSSSAPWLRATSII